MVSSSVARPPLLLLLLFVVVFMLSSLPALAASEPPAVAAAPARQPFHVATAASPLPDAGAVKNEGGRRPVRGTKKRRKARRGGGTGAWAFSAMLPRGFVPPSGSSACHNDMPATAADAQFFTCGGSGSP